MYVSCTEIKKGWYQLNGKNVLPNKVKFDLQNNGLLTLSIEGHLFFYINYMDQLLFGEEGWLGQILAGEPDEDFYTFDVKYLGDNQSFFMPLCD